MIYEVLRKIFLLFLLTFIFAENVYGQFSWFISPETGYFNSTGKMIEKKDDFLFRLDTELLYNHDKNDRQFYISLKVRPEFYGVINQSQVIRLRTTGSYGENEDNFKWKLNTTLQKQYYMGDNYNYFNEVFILAGMLSSDLLHNFPLDITAGYAYQKILIEREQEIDLFYVEGNSNISLLTGLNFYYGLYGEHFLIKRKQDSFFAEEIKSNSGWRYGLTTSFKYLQNYIFTVDYRFLIHASKLTAWFSYEQWLRFVTGKMLTEKLSFFLLADIQHRKLQSNRSITDSDLIMLYMPLNLENRFYIKTVYSLSGTIDSFIKVGYFKENLFSANYSLASWYVSGGIEIRN